MKESTGWWAEWDEKQRWWRPTVRLPGTTLSESFTCSLEGVGFRSEEGCLAYIRDNLSSFGRMREEVEAA